VPRLDAGLAQHRAWRTASARSPNLTAARPLAAERLHHLDADDRSSAARSRRLSALCTWRDKGKDARPKRSASTVIGGIATAV